MLRESFTYRPGARYYQPQISRWLSVDPLAEKYPGWTPYNYTADNPVMLVDPDGKDWVYNKKTKIYYWDKNITSKEDIKNENLEYVGVGIDNIYTHYKQNNSFFKRLFSEGPKINYVSFYKYLSNEFIRNLIKLKEYKKDMQLIENIRGFKENIYEDMNHYYIFPFYLGNVYSGKIHYYKNDYFKNQFVIKTYSEEYKKYKSDYMFRIYIYNRKAWNLNYQGEPVPSITIWLNNSSLSLSFFIWLEKIEGQVSPTGEFNERHRYND